MVGQCLHAKDAVVLNGQQDVQIKGKELEGCDYVDGRILHAKLQLRISL